MVSFLHASTQNPVCISLLPRRTVGTTRPFLLEFFNRKYRVRNTKHKIPHRSISSSSLFLLSLEPKCLSELSVLETPKPLFFLSVKNKFHKYINYYYHYYLLQLSLNSVAVVVIVVQTKQIRINIHKRNNTKHSKYKCTYYQNNPHILTPTY